MGGGPTTFRHGQTFRKSFNKERPPGGLRQNDLKMSLEAAQESDDKSSTETDDDGLIGTADIKDLGHYHNIFQPRGRECKALLSFFFVRKERVQYPNFFFKFLNFVKEGKQIFRSNLICPFFSYPSGNERNFVFFSLGMLEMVLYPEIGIRYRL